MDMQDKFAIGRRCLATFAPSLPVSPPVDSDEAGA
jgi:hypothetical protein